MIHNLLIDSLTRLHQLVGDFIGLDDVHPQGGKHFADSRLAHGDAPGQSDLKHFGHAPEPGRARASPSASGPL